MLRKRLNLIPALTLASLMYGPPVDACSCVKGEETDKSAREYVNSLLRIYPNVVVLKVVEVTDLGPNHERAKLVVIESWKGKYNPGDIVHSDTSGIGGGMCESSVRETRQQEFLYAFETEPMEIAGCGFEYTERQRKYLRRLAPARDAQPVN